MTTPKDNRRHQKLVKDDWRAVDTKLARGWSEIIIIRHRPLRNLTKATKTRKKLLEQAREIKDKEMVFWKKLSSQMSLVNKLKIWTSFCVSN